ncbi:unnamed protein product [Urochloa humidicola]
MFRIRLISKGSSGDGRVAASFGCRLVDPSSPEATTSYSMFAENSSRDVFVVRWSQLQSSRHRRPERDGIIFARCVLTVLLDPRDVTPGAAAGVKASATVPSTDLHRQFGELLRSQTGADVTFVVAGERISAHRSVLAARSPVFMAELFGGMKEEYWGNGPAHERMGGPCKG